MSRPNSPLCLNMNTLTCTPLSPQLAFTVKGWSRSCSCHLLPTTYLLPTVLPTEKWLRGLLLYLLPHEHGSPRTSSQTGSTKCLTQQFVSTRPAHMVLPRKTSRLFSLTTPQPTQPRQGSAAIHVLTNETPYIANLFGIFTELQI